MRYTGPKNRLSRRLGVDLGLKSSSKLSKRLNIPPGQHGPKGKPRSTEYGTQLTEKQKVKFAYSVTEKQLRHYFEKAAKVKGATGEKMLIALERRLDNVLYRLGIAPTRASARQLISHHHVRVNSVRVSIPSYSVKPGEVISIDQKGQQIPIVIQSTKSTEFTPPSWLERQSLVGKIVRLPTREEIATEVNEQMVVEYYSR